jgi:excisionase family DNA binding protein
MKRGTELPEGLPIGMIAEQLHCHPATVRRAIKAGRIPAVRVNVGRRRGLIRVPASWLEEALRGGAVA